MNWFSFYKKNIKNNNGKDVFYGTSDVEIDMIIKESK